jgi:N utilization substance protein B
MFAEEEDIYNISLFKDEFGDIDYEVEFYEVLYKGVTQNIEDIDKIITRSATDWPIKNISKIDLVILRMGVFELEFKKDTPKNVVIDEAVELAKKFGAEVHVFPQI